MAQEGRQADDALRWAPATRVENACASGAAALYAACDAVESGRVPVALVVGAEKMTGVGGAETTRILGNASYVKEEAAHGLTFPGIFALMAQAYFARHGEHSATLARIAAKNHANGVRNPWAQLRKDLGFEFCNTVSAQNPMVAAPLRKTDCSPVSDGAAAIVLVGDAAAARFARAVRLRSRAQVSDYLPMSRRDAASFEGPRRAWAQALAAAGCGVDDLSLAEVHDCFTIAELLTYEAMGLAAPGQGGRLLTEGVATAAGVLMALNPWLGLATLATWLIIAAFFRYSSLASVVAAVFAPFYQALIWGLEPGILALIGMSLLLVWRHEGNIRKLIAGTESKLGQKAPSGHPPAAAQHPAAQASHRPHGHTRHKKGHH